VRHLRRGKGARALARALALLMLTPTFWGAGAVRPASAQVANLPVVLVLDFANRTGVGGPLLGRSAAAALILEMKAADQWDVVRESTVQDAINRLNLQRPYDRVDLARLASDPQISAAQVVTGEIVSARVTERPAQASVTIAVRVMDVASRELVNGAVVSASSASRPGYTGGTDVLLDEAVNKAAFLARESLGRFQLPEGTVLNTTVVGNRYDALLNIGARQGVKVGMRFVVLRGRDLVGRAQVSTVDPDKSVAGVVDNFRGVKPEDRVRAIYELPPISRNNGRRAEGEAPVRIAAYAASHGAPPALGTAVAQAAPAPEQPEPDIVVEDTAPPQQRRRSGTRGLRMVGGALAVLGIAALAARKGGTETHAVTAEPFFEQATDQVGIRVRWSRPRQISHEDVVQYQIRRYSSVPPSADPAIPQDFGRVVGFVDGDVRQFIDTPHPPVDLDGVFEGQPGEEDLEETTITAVPGITEGVVYRYAVEVVYLPKVGLDEGDDGGTGGGTGDTGGLQISLPSKLSNSVIPIRPPGLNAPSDLASVDFTNVTFEGTATAGATTYVIQASTDVSFNRNVQTLARVTLSPGSPAGTAVSSGPVNLNRFFPNANTVFWRIGARSDLGGKTGGFLFTRPRQVIRSTAP